MFRIDKKNGALDLDLAVLHRLPPDRFDRPQRQLLCVGQQGHRQKEREESQHLVTIA
jgi:hypothetical protein